MLLFIVDLDGTLADTTARAEEVEKKYELVDNNWTQQHAIDFADPERIKTDKIVAGSEIIAELARRAKSKIIFLTGRSEYSRQSTRMWLKNHFNAFDSCPLIMRDNNDLSNPRDCKERMFKEIILKMYPTSEYSFCFFDDDVEMLQRFSKYGMALKSPECWDAIKFVK